MSWSHLGFSSSFNLSAGGVGQPKSETVLLVVLTRNGDTGTLAAPAFGQNTVLQLGSTGAST
ncbi:MAG: hypothetical protein H7343_13835 [Undibacterium sp.]|nr:hypothetical protein [Opitutaceae bacterium]